MSKVIVSIPVQMTIFNEIKHIFQLSTIENDKREKICNGIREIMTDQTGFRTWAP